jgi:TPR repeat protein
MFWRAVVLVCLDFASAAQGADIGGWMQHKDRAVLPADPCAELIARAARTPRNADGAADSYYASGLCYLYSDKVERDPVAAEAWLSRAAELDHPQARRTLLALREHTPGDHAAGSHCHDLGLGRKLCHGGPSPQSQ